MAVRHGVACIGVRLATPPSGRAARGLARYADDRYVGICRSHPPGEPEAAARAAQLRVKARRSGRVLHLADALLAGTVMAQDPVIATRNTSDFYDLDLGRVEVGLQPDPGCVEADSVAL